MATSTSSLESLQRYGAELYQHIEGLDKTLLADIAKKKVLDDDLKKRLEAAIEAFNAKFEVMVKKS
jgi:F0F1-type ATP synthase alpha subunit